MRQTHVAGERLFVDYAGTTLTVIDGADRRGDDGQLFVAVLGASQLHLRGSHLDADAGRLDRLAHAHLRLLRRRHGDDRCPTISRSGITKACFYEPAVNRTYAEMAAHYDTAIVPARPYKPRDKAKVEVAVQVATRWIIAKLRNRTFFSLAELNAAIRDCVAALNDRVTRHLGASRRALFEEIERPALKSLAGRALRLRRMEGMQGRARLPRRGREALLLGAAHAAAREGVGAHHGAHRRGLPPRQARCRACALLIEPQAHDGARAHAVEPPALCRLDAGAPQAAGRRDRAEAPRRWSRSSCASARTPSKASAPAIGILRLAKTYGRERLEAACGRALEIGARSYTLRQLDPEEQPRSPTARNRHGRAGDSSRQHPWPRLLPLRR